MKEYTLTMAKKTDLRNKYLGYNMLWVPTIEVEVEANTEEEAIAMANGFKGMVVWKVDNKVVWGCK